MLSAATGGMEPEKKVGGCGGDLGVPETLTHDLYQLHLHLHLHLHWRLGSASVEQTASPTSHRPNLVWRLDACHGRVT